MDSLLNRIAENNINLLKLNTHQCLEFWLYIVDNFAETKTEKAYALLMSSEYEVEFNNLTNSIKHLHRALLLLDPSKDIELMLQIYSALSYRYTDIGQYQKALKYLHSLSELAVEYGDNEFYIQAILGIGNLCSIYGDHLKALRYYQKLEALSNSINSNNLSLRYRLYMIACLLDLKRLSKAKELLDECYALKYVSDDPQLTAQVLLYSAKLLRLKNQPETALNLLIQYRQEYSDQHSFPWLNKLFAVESAYCLIKQQRGEIADVIISHQLKRTIKYSYGYYIRQLLEVKSDALASCKNFALALECEKKAQQLTVEIIKNFPINELGGHSLRRLTRLELQLRLNISETENLKLKKVSDQQKDTVAKLQQDVFHDSLTKLYNRRWFESTFIKEILPTIKHYQLLVIDIDDFKSINDEYSHLKGDIVLKLVSKILQNSVSPSHYTLRYGGEEFLIIIPSGDLEHGKKIAEQCRSEIANYDWRDTLKDRSITVSIGLTLNRNKEDHKATFLRADKALYQAKRSGKNKVCSY
ncbi:GGDEF domain-containing protein [Aliivibrio fischeri]|uniref:GGDEF domain-containing protein n=1 Tax=Aliivibrio fischeri TaxID=668 RepID=UPI0007C453BD|nr:GGDEF domain-containing protein [Aliivibrio fischeri]MCE7556175.1 GGDEF domain-containing protein [Aliivibrio fischeri]MCE7563747.1 GGDEF domain-containing protein [Aliivibrio fischeri]MCE7571014.1 GGDEF domain-containing protein [Aliivibrio fischeri]MUK93965.1 diguanylate cyclase [Aliivibrio fischeri]